MSGADVTITFASAALTAGETYAITTPADRYTSATSKAKNEEITISFTTVNILHVTALSEILSIAGADDNLIVYKQ